MQQNSHLSFCFCPLLFHLDPQHLHLLLGAIENNDVLVFERIPTLVAKMTKRKNNPRVTSCAVLTNARDKDIVDDHVLVRSEKVPPLTKLRTKKAE